MEKHVEFTILIRDKIRPCFLMERKSSNFREIINNRVGIVLENIVYSGNFIFGQK